MPDKCLDCPVPSADMDGFIVSGPGGAPRSESAGVSSSEGPFAKEAPQTGHFILKGKVSSSSPLPDVPEPGWAYEAAEAGTYGGAQATVGDVVWCAGVNPVRWAILQSDSGSAVSVEQILSSGTKIATVTVGGQATDLYCETGGGIQTLSGDFGCETHELSPAVDEPAVLYATRIVYLDQTGYEALQAGNKPSSAHYEYAVTNGTVVHESSSFTTRPVYSEPSVQVPYAIALSTGTDQYASGYKLAEANVMDWPYGGAVKISDLLAAGEAGAKLVHGGEDVYGDGTLDIYASFSSLAVGDPTNPPPYVVSYSARKDAVTEDVLTAKIDGKDGSGEIASSVDVSPLLNYIGGRVEEVPAGDSEMLPLLDYQNPGVEPPFYFCDELNFSNSGSLINPDAYAFSDGVLTVSFSASSLVPESFTPLFYYGDPSDPPTLVIAYGKLDSSTGMPAQFTFETALASPLVLDGFTFSSNQAVPTGNTVSLVTKRLEGDAPAYSFTLYSGSGEMKKVLRLYPSCDGVIDLSPLVSDSDPDPAPAPASDECGDYVRVYSGGGARGVDSISVDFSAIMSNSDTPDVDGFSDVLVVTTFFDPSIDVKASALYPSSGLPNDLTARISHPNYSSEVAGLGFARFWNDGGMVRMSFGGGYNYSESPIVVNDTYCFNMGGYLIERYAYIPIVTISSVMQGSGTADVNFHVYARCPHHRGDSPQPNQPNL